MELPEFPSRSSSPERAERTKPSRQQSMEFNHRIERHGSLSRDTSTLADFSFHWVKKISPFAIIYVQACEHPIFQKLFNFPNASDVYYY
jgi:hypothetical protein